MKLHLTADQFDCHEPYHHGFFAVNDAVAAENGVRAGAFLP
jgi:hypothetical protein